MVDTSLFYQDVYSVVKEIPAGRVATYKQIAVLTGFPQHARLVGRALRAGHVPLVWQLSLPPGGEWLWTPCSVLAGTESIAGSRRCGFQKERKRGYAALCLESGWSGIRDLLISDAR